MSYYVDSSAIVKLLIDEDETEAFEIWLTEQRFMPVTSDLGVVEVSRTAAVRAGIGLEKVDRALKPFEQVRLSPECFDRARDVRPTHLRSLDALHLACAIGLGYALLGLVTYDRKLADAAKLNGMRVVAPG